MVRPVKKKVMCGNIQIGGGAPVSIQSMLKVPAPDIQAALSQIEGLTEAGCHIIRIAVPDPEAVSAFGIIKKKLKPDAPPLVADIHFDYRLAISAIKNGAAISSTVGCRSSTVATEIPGQWPVNKLPY